MSRFRTLGRGEQMRDKLNPDGLAYRTELQLLRDDFTTTPDPTVHREGCSICTDPEYAQMGLPLCYACRVCNGHVPADDNRCDDCGVIQDDCGPFDPEAAELVWALFGWLWLLGGRTELETWAGDELVSWCDGCGEIIWADRWLVGLDGTLCDGCYRAGVDS